MSDRIYTSGYLAQLLQSSVFHIRLAAEEAGVKPCLFLNEVDHYDEVAVVAIRRQLAREREANSESIRKDNA